MADTVCVVAVVANATVVHIIQIIVSVVVAGCGCEPIVIAYQLCPFHYSKSSGLLLKIVLENTSIQNIFLLTNILIHFYFIMIFSLKDTICFNISLIQP